MPSQILFLCLLVFAFISLSTCKIPTDNCSNKLTCGGCLRTVNCVWCKAEDFSGPRCDTVDNFKSRKICDRNNLENPTRTLKTNESSESQIPGQFSLSSATLKQRLGVKSNVSVSFRPDPKRSLDLYYLLDASCTMLQVREGMIHFAQDLVDSLSELTKDVRMGFGSFVDKPVMPFIRDPREAVDGWGRNCGSHPVAGTYSFRNYLSLIDSPERFQEAVNLSDFSGNYDLPEGGLDAVLQVAVCEDQIGWRSESLKVLVFATDDKSFHISGDGKLGGIHRPHDGNCYLERRKGSFDEYSMATEFDYPSIALVNDKIKRQNVHVVFAVPNTSLYAGLSELIQGSATAFLNVNVSRNIADVVKQELKRIQSSVDLVEAEESEFYRIKYFTKCRETSEFVQGSKCDFEGANEEQNIKYKVEVEVLRCPENGSQLEQVINIRPLGYSSSFKILLHLACNCSCEEPMRNSGGPNGNNSNCRHGTLQCGSCLCDEGYCGKECDRPLKEISALTCYRKGLECSGRGQCRCGECECQEGYIGDSCQYNLTKCPMGVNGKICSGHGVCNVRSLPMEERTEIEDVFVCGCYPGFTGEACNCRDEQSGCRPTQDGPLCSGNGKCNCNRCVCSRGYSGPFCSSCYLTASQQQQVSVNPEFRSCMDSVLSKEETQAASSQQQQQLSACFSKHLPLHSIEFSDETGQNKNCSSGSSCQREMYSHPTTGCKHPFLIKCLRSNSSQVDVAWSPTGVNCPGPVDYLGIFIGGAGAIVLAGLIAIIVWKVGTHYHDKREYLKFEKERAQAKWSTENNPLYRASTTMHMNPSYGANLGTE